MAHDLLKLGIMLAILTVAAALIALFVSSYLTTYHPGAKNQTSAVSTGIAGGKSGKPAHPSPTPKPGQINATMGKGGFYPQNIQYPPSAPVPMIPVMPQVQPQGGVPQLYRQPGPPPTISTPAPVVPTERPGANYEIPVVPRSSHLEAWYYLIQDLLGLFPRLFSGQYSAFPQWPRFWF